MIHRIPIAQLISGGNKTVKDVADKFADPKSDKIKLLVNILNSNEKVRELVASVAILGPVNPIYVSVDCTHIYSGVSRYMAHVALTLLGLQGFDHINVIPTTPIMKQGS